MDRIYVFFQKSRHNDYEYTHLKQSFARNGRKEHFNAPFGCQKMWSLLLLIFLFIYLLVLLLVDVFSGFDVTPHRNISNDVDHC